MGKTGYVSRNIDTCPKNVQYSMFSNLKKKKKRKNTSWKKLHLVQTIEQLNNVRALVIHTKNKPTNGQTDFT